MTGIEGIGWQATPRVASRNRAKAQEFAVPADAHIGDSRAAEATPAASLASMLTLQEVNDGTVQDREARRHGFDMLAALQALQRAMLGGEDDTTALQRLAELASHVPLATDQRTAALVSAIVLRVRVELARRQDRVDAK